MSVPPTSLTRLPRLHGLAVVLCCLLSVLAPFSEGTVVQWLDATSPAEGTASTLSEDDSIEDEEDVISGRARGDTCRSHRKRQSAVPLCLRVCLAACCPSPPPFRAAAPDHLAPLSERARHNGWGGPLLC